MASLGEWSEAQIDVAFASCTGQPSLALARMIEVGIEMWRTQSPGEASRHGLTVTVAFRVASKIHDHRYVNAFSDLFAHVGEKAIGMQLTQGVVHAISRLPRMFDHAGVHEIERGMFYSLINANTQLRCAVRETIADFQIRPVVTDCDEMWTAALMRRAPLDAGELTQLLFLGWDPSPAKAKELLHLADTMGPRAIHGYPNLPQAGHRALARLHALVLNATMQESRPDRESSRSNPGL
jgi:hypothetical protein